MNKYNNLILRIAMKYHIHKGQYESELKWKTRLIYSVCGIMAYASLWDTDNEKTVSVVHLRERISKVLEDYETLYPEIQNFMPVAAQSVKNFESRIIETFENTGMVYHLPNRVVSAMKCEVQAGNVLFQRGIALDDISCVSGIGLYKNCNTVAQLNKIKKMFGLEMFELQAIWKMILSQATWKKGMQFSSNTEYLRIIPPFNRGYWVDRPDRTGKISILRTGNNGSKIYYLYRYFSSELEVSQLASWQVDNNNYRSIACACLASLDVMPAIDYTIDGELVHIHLNYLLPPRELNFLKLYSWPEGEYLQQNDFRRSLSMNVFSVIKSILTDEGYTFSKEDKSDGTRG